MAQDNESSQVLGMGATKRYIVNISNDWQFLFGPHTTPVSGTPVLKIAAEFDTASFDDIRLTAYLYDPATGSVRSAATCSFVISLVSAPGWSESVIDTVAGSALPNSYFFATVNLAALAPAVLDGSATLMIEATATRLASTFRDRVYINHLGIYDTTTRLKQDVEFLDLTKLDE